MVDAVDSKSTGGNPVPVQVRPLVPQINYVHMDSVETLDAIGFLLFYRIYWQKILR